MARKRTLHAAGLLLPLLEVVASLLLVVQLSTAQQLLQPYGPAVKLTSVPLLALQPSHKYGAAEAVPGSWQRMPQQGAGLPSWQGRVAIADEISELSLARQRQQVEMSNAQLHEELDQLAKSAHALHMGSAVAVQRGADNTQAALPKLASSQHAAPLTPIVVDAPAPYPCIQLSECCCFS